MRICQLHYRKVNDKIFKIKQMKNGTYMDFLSAFYNCAILCKL